MATLSQAYDIIVNSIRSQVEFANDRDSKRPIPMYVGDMGEGKTSHICQIIKDALKARCIILSLAQYDPAEFGGWIVAQGDQMVRLRPDWMPVNSPEEDARAAKGEVIGVIFIDEPQNAATALQNIAAQLTNERRVGNHRLPDGWAIVLAGNKDSNRAGTTKMPSHLRDRLMMIPIEASMEDFIGYANKVGMSHLVTGFVRARPDLLSKYERDAVAWPSPRGWDRVSTILSWGMDTVQQHIAIASQIGEGVAAEFAGYCRIADKMGDPAEAIKNPTTYAVPDADPSATYAMSAALANMATADNFGAILTYVARFPHKEFSVFTVKDACSRKPDLKKVPALRDFLLNEGKTLMKNW